MAPKKAAPVVAKEPQLPPIIETEESKVMLDQFTKTLTAKSAEDYITYVNEVVSLVKTDGLSGFNKYMVVERIRRAAADKANNIGREISMVVLKALYEAFGRGSEPFLIPLVPSILSLYSDKIPSVRAAADAAGKLFASSVCPFAVKQFLPAIFQGMLDRKNWKTIEASLNLLVTLSQNGPRQLSLCLPDIIPNVGDLMGDSKPEVRKAAYEAMTQSCNSIGNRDIEAFIPALVSCIARPLEVSG
jgi:elongation factor 3